MLYAKEYLISYSYTIKDAVIYNEKLQIARAMQPCKGTPLSKTLIVAYPKSGDSASLRRIILENFDDFFTYITQLGLDVKHREKTKNMQYSSTTKLILPTTCFKVDFNDSFVTITAIK